MIRWLVDGSVKARRAIAVIGVVVMVFGLMNVSDTKVDSLPEFQPVSVRVQTEALGLSAEEVEQLITVPLEQDLLAGVAWIDTIRSRSIPSLSYIDIDFEEGTDLYRARQVVQERLSQAAALPNVSKPPQMIQPTSSTSRVAMMSLTSTSLKPVEVGVLARWTVLPRLLAVNGVANVSVWGQRDRQLQVQIDPEKLQAENVTIEEVIGTTGNALWSSPLTFLEASTPGSGGFIETAAQRIGVQHQLPIVAPEDLAGLPLETEDGVDDLKLGDIADVVEGNQPLIGDAIVGDADAGFMLVVEKLPGSNTAAVAAGVEKAINELRPGLTGVDIDSKVFRADHYADDTDSNLSSTLWIMLVLLVVALAFLLLRWQPAVITIVAVLLTFSVAMFALRQWGPGINLVTGVGLLLALAAVVDDALRSYDAMSRRSGAVGSMASAMRTTVGGIVWATVIAAAALIPMLMVNGLAGDAFFPAAARWAIAVFVVSALVSATVTAALGTLLIRPDTKPGLASPVLDAAAKAVGGVGAALAKLPVAGVVAAVAAIALGVVLIPSADKAVIPQLADRSLLVEFTGPFGTSLPEMERVTDRAVAEIRALAGVEKVAAHIGQASQGDLPVGSESAQLWVTLADSADYGRLIKEVDSIAGGYPGIDGVTTTYSGERMRQELAGPEGEMTVRIYGQDFGVMRDKANEITAAVGGISGVKSATVAAPEPEPTIEVLVDLDKAQAVGLKPGDVRRTAAVMIAGLQVGNLYENQKVFDVTVWSKPEARASVTSVEKLPVPLPAGGFTTIGDVSTVRVRPILPAIPHEDVSRYLDITVQIDGDVSDVESKADAAVKAIAMPFEYHAEVLTDYADYSDAKQRLWMFGIAALIAVFLLFQACFNSWRLALLTTISLPVALVGGVIAARIDGGPMSVATVAGIAGVAALAARQAIGLARTYRDLRADGAAYGVGLSTDGMRRAAPLTLASSLVPLIVLIPLAASGSSAGLEALSKTAVVMIGGLITTAIWTLWVLPGLHAAFGPKVDPKQLSFEDDFLAAEHELDLAGAGD